MRKLVLIGSAITMLIVAPLLAASTGNAQSMKKHGIKLRLLQKWPKGPGYEVLQRKRWDTIESETIATY